MTLKQSQKKYALFIGRYQTLHEGHKYLFRTKVESGKPVLVAIREVPIDDKNPYTTEEVIKMFHEDAEVSKWISCGLLKVIVIPDIEGVYYGRDVGYNIEKIEVPIDIAQISATKLREQNASSKKKARS